MTKSVWLTSITVIAAVSSMTWAMTWAYEAFQGPTELIQYDPDRAFEGYTMFGAQSGENVYLIDMQAEALLPARSVTVPMALWPTPSEDRTSSSKSLAEASTPDSPSDAL